MCSLVNKAFSELARFFKGFCRIQLIIKPFSMNANLTLDEMILQYSENPFIDDEMFTRPEISDHQQKQKVLSRLLMIASNLFSKAPMKELGSYKHRYEINYGI